MIRIKFFSLILIPLVLCCCTNGPTSDWTKQVPLNDPDSLVKKTKTLSLEEIADLSKMSLSDRETRLLALGYVLVDTLRSASFEENRMLDWVNPDLIENGKFKEVISYWPSHYPARGEDAGWVDCQMLNSENYVAWKEAMKRDKRIVESAGTQLGLGINSVLTRYTASADSMQYDFGIGSASSSIPQYSVAVRSMKGIMYPLASPPKPADTKPRESKEDPKHKVTDLDLG